MRDLLIRNAARVFGYEIEGGACVVVAEAKVAGVVAESSVTKETLSGMGIDTAGGPEELDVAGRAVVPGFVDAHTHLVFAGDRADEFGARLAGRPYEAGGIMRSVEATRAATLDELTAGVVERARRCLEGGTTTIEVKSGYGLDVETEVRSLEAIERARSETAAGLVATFLGAHLDPEPGYVDLVVEEMLPACAPLAVSCDAFCDVGALSVESTRRVLEAGKAHGLVPRVHAEELAHSGGAALAAEVGCVSADHLVHATRDDARALAASGVTAVLLPATSFCLRSVYAPARMLMDEGVEVALATDCNPGTSYTTSMPFVIAVACSEYGMSADEAVLAATRGGAAALGRDDVGHLGRGARADVVVIEGEHWVDIAYHPGMDVVANVVKDGEVVL